MKECPPTVEESYITAGHATNLRVVAEKRGSIDIIVAAGWCDSRVGTALMRLASEWDGAAKKPHMPDTDYTMLRAKLKSLTPVLNQVVDVMARMGIANPETKAGPILGFWLSQECRSCRGLKFLTIRDTPVLSSQRCKACYGTGLGWPPEGREGRRVLAWMDDAVNQARSSIKRRLRA